MTMDIVLFLCLVAAPADCLERRVPFSVEPAPASLCYTGAAVAAIAEAMRVPANRDRQLRGWRCVPHDFKDTRI